MKRLAVVVSVGLALVVVLAAQALRAPERQPVVPIELRAPPAVTREDSRGTPQPEKGPSQESGSPAHPRQVPANSPPQSQRPSSVGQSSPPPAGGSDDGEDEGRGRDDADGGDDAGDDAGDDDAGDG